MEDLIDQSRQKPPSDSGALSSVPAVLLVEDDPLQSHELRMFLTRRGIENKGLSLGSAALHLLEHVRPKVLIVDHNLPDIDGMTVAERARRLSPATSVVLVSGRLGEVAPAALEQRGIATFLKKPVSLPKLLKVIRALLKAEDKVIGMEARAPIIRWFTPR